MVDKLVKSVKTGEPTVDEIEAAEALKAVANIKPTEAFLEAEANGESSDDGDSKAPKRKSRNKDQGGGSAVSSLNNQARTNSDLAANDGFRGTPAENSTASAPKK